jgi:hypothetical protein
MGTGLEATMRSRRPFMFGLAALALAPRLFRTRAQADEGVDLALVLAADVSRSINDREFDLQRQGYAAAITNAQVLDAIHTGPHGAIALSFVEWAGEEEQKVVVGWSTIRDKPDADKFAATLLAAPRSFLGRTAIGTVIGVAAGLIGESGIQAPRQVIDISGDGTSNQGLVVTEARDAAVKAGIVINGLAIFNKEAAAQGGYLALHTNPPGGLAKYYRENVIGGTGSFVEQIENFDSFGDAMIRKLVNEIAMAHAVQGVG